MAEVLFKIAGGVFGLVLVWFLSRALFRNMSPPLHPDLEEALRLQKSDPARADLLADQYFRGEAAREEAERAALWKRVPADSLAAEELRRRLSADLETNAAVLREHSDPVLHRNVEQDQAQIREQLSRLDGLIRAGRASG